MTEKSWSISYSFVLNGKENEDTTLIVFAATIREALDAAEEQLTKDAAEQGWERWKVWDIGICDTDIW